MLTTITQLNQTRSFGYDGYGRLYQRTTPEQGTATYAYNPDDTLASMTDARGAVATYGYNNNRGLVTQRRGEQWQALVEMFRIQEKFSIS